jgi:hypothetical protein
MWQGDPPRRWSGGASKSPLVKPGPSPPRRVGIAATDPAAPCPADARDEPDRSFDRADDPDIRRRSGGRAVARLTASGEQAGGSMFRVRIGDEVD